MQQEGTDRAANARRNEGSPTTKATRRRTSSSCSTLLLPGSGSGSLVLPLALVVAVRKILFAYGLRLLATSPSDVCVAVERVSCRGGGEQGIGAEQEVVQRGV